MKRCKSIKFIIEQIEKKVKKIMLLEKLCIFPHLRNQRELEPIFEMLSSYFLYHRLQMNRAAN